MEDRIEAELRLLASRYPEIEYRPEGQWVKVPLQALPAGWQPEVLDVSFQIPTGFPGTPPYGIYVPVGITFCGNRPDNYAEPAPSQPPFGGAWGILSWTPEEGVWQPKIDVATGSNLLNWVIGFSQRFKEGK